MESWGVITADFLLATLVIIIILSNLVAIAVDRIDTANDIGEASQARIMGENLAELIETTYSNGQGYYTTFKTPHNISGSNYIVNLDSTGLYIFINRKICYSHIGSKFIRGEAYQTFDGAILKPDKTYNISNIKDMCNITRIVVREI